jgi:two-component system osmolarity sensor histidine kinase EnvZ
MEAMLNGYLDFARGMGKEKPQATQLSDFISKSVRGRALDVKPFQDREVSIRPLMLQRCLDNLISNALKYGKSCVLSVAPSEGFLLISVEDDGPGIPAEQRQNAFKAFQRLDEARNQNTEGVGLGLSISQDIAQLHGGTILLSDSGLGGLKATLRLPL